MWMLRCNGKSLMTRGHGTTSLKDGLTGGRPKCYERRLGTPVSPKTELPTRCTSRKELRAPQLHHRSAGVDWAQNLACACDLDKHTWQTKPGSSDEADRGRTIDRTIAKPVMRTSTGSKMRPNMATAFEADEATRAAHPPARPLIHPTTPTRSHPHLCHALPHPRGLLSFSTSPPSSEKTAFFFPLAGHLKNYYRARPNLCSLAHTQLRGADAPLG